MKTSLLLLLISACAVSGHAQDTAGIQCDSTDCTISVKLMRTHAVSGAALGINLVRPTKEADVIEKHWDATAQVTPSTPAGGPDVLTLKLTTPATPVDKTASYVLSIPFIPSTTGPATRAEIHMTPLFSGLSAQLQSFATAGDFCPGGVMILLKGTLPNPADWDQIHTYFGERERDPNKGIAIQAGAADAYSAQTVRTLVRKVRNVEVIKQGEVPYSVCFTTVHALPPGSFNMSLRFGAGAPPMLAALGDIKAKNLDGSQGPSMTNASAPAGTVGARPLERNLDLGLAYTQSRNLKTRAIDRLGVLDLRFAPLLDIHHRNGQEFLDPKTIPNWSWFLTPIFLDANVSTGPIVDNTVALNRISFGPQLEFRYMHLRPKAGEKFTIPRYGNVHRFTLAFNHNSDRDFKQREYVAQFQYQPLLGVLNKPRATRFIFVDDKVIGGKALSLPQFGWLVQPKFGMEMGDTYYRHNPARAVTPSTFVRRGYAGLDVTLEATDRLMFAFSDTLYTRGEIGPAHLVNHVKLETDFLLNSALRETEQAVFVIYERGSLPPFDKLTVNAVRVGYRIRSENWFGALR